MTIFDNSKWCFLLIFYTPYHSLLYHKRVYIMQENKYSAYNLKNYKDLPQISNLSPQDVEAIDVVGRVLPFKTNNYVVEELIDWNNIPNDPMFTLAFPRKEMLSVSHYNQVLKVINQDENDPIYKEKINKIRLKLNPNPAGQEHKYSFNVWKQVARNAT